MADEVKLGDKLPRFVVKDHKGYKVEDQNILGSNVVIYFYPKDETPGCTKQACDLQINLSHFDKMGVLVLGVSPDSVESHQKFRENHQLKFNLLSDPDKKMCQAFGILEGEKVIRSTFLIDQSGHIRWMEKPVKVEGHSERVMEAVNKFCTNPVYNYQNFLKDYKEFFDGKLPKIQSSDDLKKEIKDKFGIKESDK